MKSCRLPEYTSTDPSGESAIGDPDWRASAPASSGSRTTDLTTGSGLIGRSRSHPEIPNASDANTSAPTPSTWGRAQRPLCSEASAATETAVDDVGPNVGLASACENSSA